MTDDYEIFEGKIDREELESRIGEKVKEFQGLLTRAGAISIIASELGIETKEKPAEICIKISEIIEGTMNIELVGRIIRKSEVKTFTKKSTGGPGRVLRLELGDETGRMPVVLWDEKVEEAIALEEGDVVRIHGGFAKKGINGRLELTLQRRGGVERSDERISIDGLAPKRAEIGSLHEDMGEIKVIGAVVNVSDVREYERDGRIFKVCSLFIQDNTGQARVSLWNQNAERSSQISIGDIIEIENCSARNGFNGMEIQTNSYTRLNLNPDIDGLSLPTIDTNVQISDITSEMQFFSVCGTLVRAYEPRTFERDDGSQGVVASIEIRDETGTCRASLWDDKARIVQGLPEGTGIVLEGCRAREGMDGVEISIGASGRVLPRLPDLESYAPKPDGLARVIEIKDGAIKAITKDGPLLLLTEEQDFSSGDLVKYDGKMERGGLRARSIEASNEEYPLLEDLISPPRAKIVEMAPERLVRIRGLVRQVTPTSDYKILRLDDGEGMATGYFSGEVEAGREYDILARTFSNGGNLEFFTREAERIDNMDEAYRLLELF